MKKVRGYWVYSIVFMLLAAWGCQQTQSSPVRQTSSTNTVSQQTASLSANEASNHIGSSATVCGTVVGTNYATSSKGKPTFLNFDKPYPNHPFVVVIWDSDRSKFPSKPENYYLNKRLCATGLIESYKGKPEIVARAKNQLFFNN